MIASENGPESPTTRLLLLTMSLYMDKTGGKCFPSTRTLSVDTALSRKAVMEHIQKAEAAGWIKIMSAGVNGRGWKRSSYQAATPSDVVTESNHVIHERGNPTSPPKARRGHPHSHNVVTQGDLNYPIELASNKSRTFLLKNGSDFFVDDQFFSILNQTYPTIDIDSELKKIKAWCFANPEKRKTARGAMKFVNGWMQRAESGNGNQKSKQIDQPPKEFDFANQIKTV